jgi:endonuclease YncB( thermonuclease family)
MTRLWLLLASCLIVSTAAAQQPSQSVCGSARVVDGDGIVIRGTSFRLLGVDAPEPYQWCLNASCERYACGIVARDLLNAHIAGRTVCCAPPQ